MIDRTNSSRRKSKLFLVFIASFMMGWLDVFRNDDVGGDIEDKTSTSSSLLLGFISFDGHDETFKSELKSQLIFVTTFLLALVALRLWFSHSVPSTTLSGAHTLNVHRLNEACMYKEVMLAYLNAAILEPVLSIGGIQQVNDIHLLINVAELVSLCWWIWLISDAFDFADVMQVYKFNYEFREDYEAEKGNKFFFLRLSDKKASAKVERKGFMGNLKRDVALWGMLSAIAAAWLPGGITHRDVLHSYAVVLLWIVLHHSSRSATSWGINYFYTFLFPSAALMPLEYCLPLMDTADVVEDLEFVADYRAFVIERTGVELMIEI